MIGDNAQLDAFVSEHRWAVLTTLRSDGSASNSVVAYARDGDALVVSTPARTLKARTLRADPRVTLTVISNAEPFNFVTIEGGAAVETEGLTQATRLVFANLTEVGYAEPEDLDTWIVDDDRVIIRIAPQRVSGVIR